MNVNKAERIVRCICLLHNIIIDLEGTTHCSVPDPGVLGPVPPGDRDLTGRQPSGNYLP
jgi:hypothetical protein